MSDLVLGVFRLNGRLLASGDALVADLGLSSARWQVMGAVELAGEALPVAHIARNMGLRRQSVQRIVNELVWEGLLALSDNPYHARAKLVRLTDKGRETMAMLDERKASWTAMLEAGLTPERIADAAALLATLTDRLAEPGD